MTRLDIDLDHDTVPCPNGVTAPICGEEGVGTASSDAARAGCPLRAPRT